MQLTSHNSTVSTLPQAKCLGFMWASTLSAKSGIEQNINRARKEFFAFGSICCFLGYSNPLSAREIVEICLIPTLLYSAENWILDDISLNLLERFQAELGRRILKLSKHHSSLSTMIGLSWPTMKSRILKCKLRFLGKLISDDRNNIATRTLRTIGSQNVYDISIVQQCIFLDSTLGTKSTASFLNNMDNVATTVRAELKTISATVRESVLQETANHQSVMLASKVNWLRVLEAAREKGQYWTGIVQSFYRLLTTPVFGERTYRICGSFIPPDTSFIEYFSLLHVTSSVSLTSLMSDLTSDSDLGNNSFHSMKYFVCAYKCQQ